MGRLVSLQIITPIENISALFELIIQNTSAATEQELRSILAARTAPGDTCLCFIVALDELVNEINTHALDRADLVSIGCVWTSFSFGDRYLLMSATSSCRDMARAFEESQSVRSLFTQIARHSGSEALLLLDDWNQSALFWCSDEPTIQKDAEYGHSVDQLCQSMMMPFISTRDPGDGLLTRG